MKPAPGRPYYRGGDIAQPERIQTSLMLSVFEGLSLVLVILTMALLIHVGWGVVGEPEVRSVADQVAKLLGVTSLSR